MGYEAPLSPINWSRVHRKDAHMCTITCVRLYRNFLGVSFSKKKRLLWNKSIAKLFRDNLIEVID